MNSYSLTKELGSQVALVVKNQPGRLKRCGLWDLPRSGIEPVSPALVGKFFTMEPSGKPQKTLLEKLR